MPLWYGGDDIPDQSGRTVIITGGTSGLGLSTAKSLTSRGAQVIITGRSSTKGEKAISAVRAFTDKGQIEFIRCDVSNLKAVKEFADDYKRSGRKLHCLVNNAGTALPPHSITENGFELTLASNYFGPVYLTHLLLDVLKASAPSRVVYEASLLEQWGEVNWDDLGGKFSKTSDMGMYGTSKLYLLMMSQALQQRLQGSGVDVYAVQPGLTSTSLYSGMQKTFLFYWFFVTMTFFLGQSPERGCLSLLYCATAPELQGKGGSYWGPRYFKLFIPNLFNTDPCYAQHKLANNSEACSRLFTETAKLLAKQDPATNGLLRDAVKNEE
ncbi:hypothetical protein WJX82_007247 [Trebouxia sp. C0006]